MGKLARNSFLHTETTRFLLSTRTDAQRMSQVSWNLGGDPG